jgi:hypothetical protein
MAELGHADLIDPDDIDGPDEHVDADLIWGPGVHAPDAAARPWLQPPPPVLGVPAAEHAAGFFARQRVTRAAQEAAAARRRTLRPPAPQVPATALTRAQLAERGAKAAVQLWDAAAAAGWSLSATYARGPLSTERTLCPRCLTWQKITKAGAIGVHGPKADRCAQTDPDPASPDFQVVDSVIIRALSPARPECFGRGAHRLAAMWVDAGDDPGKAQYEAVECQLWHAGDRPRDAEVVAVRSTLKAIAAGRKRPAVKRAPRARRAA